jgi:hypothetical protein
MLVVTSVTAVTTFWGMASGGIYSHRVLIPISLFIIMVHSFLVFDP